MSYDTIDEAGTFTESQIRNVNRPQAIVKNGSLHPFKRASALYMQIMHLRASMQDNLFGLSVALAALPPYTSRGHGWKGRIKNRQITGHWNQERSKYQPHQGAAECGRRVFQSLTAPQRAVARQMGEQIYAEEMDRRELEVGL